MTISAPMLRWYDQRRRQLPWRAAPRRAGDPYHVWLSEIMLQQTTVTAVIPYFNRFIDLWPELGDLATARLDDVLREWAGLGYYARARNLHLCAAQIEGKFGGQMPDCEKQLLSLPGIGSYTAAAICAIVFDKPAIVVDGNIERIMARLHTLQIPLPRARPQLYAFASALTPQSRAGDYAQALMDLGATICRPKTPLCQDCPISAHCRAFQDNKAADYPLRTPKKTRPTRYGRIYWLERDDGTVFLRRRKPKGLLGGMMEFPSSDWAGQPVTSHDQAPCRANWRKQPGEIRHVFTHFELKLTVYRALHDPKSPAAPLEGRWVAPSKFNNEALPSLMRKVAALFSD